MCFRWQRKEAKRMLTRWADEKAEIELCFDYSMFIVLLCVSWCFVCVNVLNKYVWYSSWCVYKTQKFAPFYPTAEMSKNKNISTDLQMRYSRISLVPAVTPKFHFFFCRNDALKKITFHWNVFDMSIQKKWPSILFLQFAFLTWSLVPTECWWIPNGSVVMYDNYITPFFVRHAETTCSVLVAFRSLTRGKTAIS